MGLVEYSESGSSASDSEPAPPPTVAKPKPTGKKPFHKVVQDGKIKISLGPHSTLTGATEPASHEPPAKRARTAGASRFSDFNSLLPPPKPVMAPAPSRHGVNLKTSAAPGFSRSDEAAPAASPQDKPPRDTQAPPALPEPSIPQGMKPADQVTLVGKPLMFKPLFVARNLNKKKSAVKTGASLAASAAVPVASVKADTEKPPDAPPEAPSKSLFSLHTQAEPQAEEAYTASADLEPFFPPPMAPQSQVASHEAAVQAQQPTVADSLDNIADDLNLSAAARRELFGRSGRSGQSAKQVINFNLDQEYRHNEALRAAGDEQIHQPVRAIQSGKHSLKQLVQNVHNQREALEDTFVKGKSNRKEASSRYGW